MGVLTKLQNSAKIAANSSVIYVFNSVLYFFKKWKHRFTKCQWLSNRSFLFITLLTHLYVDFINGLLSIVSRQFLWEQDMSWTILTGFLWIFFWPYKQSFQVTLWLRLVFLNHFVLQFFQLYLVVFWELTADPH